MCKFYKFYICAFVGVIIGGKYVKCVRKLSRATNTACLVFHISGVQRADQHSQTSQMSMRLALQNHFWSLGRQNGPKKLKLTIESVTSSYQPMSVTVETAVVVTWDIRNAVLCYRASGMSGHTSQFIWEIQSSNTSQYKGAHFFNYEYIQFNSYIISRIRHKPLISTTCRIY